MFFVVLVLFYLPFVLCVVPNVAGVTGLYIRRCAIYVLYKHCYSGKRSIMWTMWLVISRKLSCRGITLVTEETQLSFYKNRDNSNYCSTMLDLNGLYAYNIDTFRVWCSQWWILKMNRQRTQRMNYPCINQTHCLVKRLIWEPPPPLQKIKRSSKQTSKTLEHKKYIHKKHKTKQ